MTNAGLSQSLARGESGTVSFVADTENPRAIAQVVCSLLNSTDGGTVYVGVGEDGRPVDGSWTVDDARSLERALQVEISPIALFSVSVDTVKDGDLLTIDVPPGSERPYVVAGAVWVRSGAETRPAQAQDIRALFVGAEQAGLRWERRISTGMDERDLDLALVRRVRERAEGIGRLALIDAPSEMEMLRELAYWRPKGFTHACDVVFGRTPGRRLPQTRVQFLELEDDKADDAYGDYRWFEGSAIEVVEQVFSALQSHKRTRARFHEGSLEREERPAYLDFPLREGIVNALAHRSYESHSGGAKVSVFPNRIEFWNTGRLPPEITIKELPRKHQSYPTNPDIAHAFYLHGLMDRTGRGTARIAEACKQIGAPAPVWTEDRGGVTLTLFAALAPGEAIATQLNERQRAFVERTPPGKTVNLAYYVEHFAPDISDRQARRELAELENFRLVRKEGQSVATVYRRLKD